MFLYEELTARKAVVAARRRLLTERGSPLGLLYVLYGDPELSKEDDSIRLLAAATAAGPGESA